MAQTSIGEFARRSRLSPKALRLHDELGLVRPARVDTASGYRFHEETQLERARLVAVLRRLEVPLAEVRAVLAMEPEAAAQRIAQFGAPAETEHSARRDLARYLVDRLGGRRSVMYEVQTREIPSRALLCLKRNVDGWMGAWALIGYFALTLSPAKGVHPSHNFGLTAT